MERLAIDEIIEHCKRKTKLYEEVGKSINFETIELKGAIREYWEHKQVKEYLEELKQYSDAEKQSLLLRFPCHIGDSIYSVIEDGLTIIELKFSLDFYVRRKNDFGKTVFLTQAEAERKLKEMEV